MVLLVSQVRSSQWEEKIKKRRHKTAVLTRELEPRVSRGVAHARRGVSAVGHVRLGALGLAVDHSQAQAQAFGVGLSPGQRDNDGGVGRLNVFNQCKQFIDTKKTKKTR